MEEEILKIFDEKQNYIGESTREEVHRLGYWHETFHFWLISQEEDQYYLYFQLRSMIKKDYPNLLDITAAGHLLATESVADGVREVKEEIGIDIKMDELEELGVIPYSNTQKEVKDNEFAHVFLLNKNIHFDEFCLQKEEVAGIFKAKLKHFTELVNNKRESLKLIGYQFNQDGLKASSERIVTKSDFVPHDDQFYKKTISAIAAAIERNNTNI
ncbi:NUDIX hydrolase [Sutcliffiella deserti]|uniref:NUDIX hydrolase n=1 Tax=Sutcliffiella deserti TaxID=2875501 RepID=UPI001CC16D2B|nr:NUDIX domain-containing protein [Sutcliffiella deserti]